MTAFNKSKPMPAWITRRHANVNTRRGQRYYLQIWRAQPPWADVDAIRRLYRRAAELRRQGHDVEVDHVVPLCHPLLCGLHIPLNLRIVPRKHNATKSDRTFPDQPYRQFDIFWRTHADPHFELKATEPT